MSCSAHPMAEEVDIEPLPAPSGRARRLNAAAEADAVPRWAAIVLERTQVPIDAWMVAAVLEAEGLRDADARERFGCPDLFAFAERVFVVARAEARRRPRPAAPEARRERSGLLRNLARGSVFALPMLGQVLCVAFTGHSLCASADFGPAQATSVGLAMLWSLVATGPVMSALGREGAVRLQERDWAGLEVSCRWLVRAGVLGVLASVLVTAAIQLATGLFAPRLFGVTLIYAIALSLLWLGLACCQALRLHGFTFATTLLGGLAVAAAATWHVASVLLVQFVAILAVAAGAFARAFGHLRARRSTAAKPAGQELGFPTPGEVAVGALVPYAAYGLGNAGLLVVDRLLAWSAPGRIQPQALWFHGPYELGMDGALLSALVPLAYLEHAVHRFYDALHDAGASVPLSDLPAHEARITRAVRRALRVLVALSCASVVGAWAVGHVLQAEGLGHVLGHLEDPGDAPLVRHAFWCGALAYQLLVLGLGGALLFFSLNRPIPVVKAVWRALGVATATGFIASRALSPEHATLGLLLGTAMFAAEMVAGARDLIRKGAYHEYAAF
jgi:hypothetical protein